MIGIPPKQVAVIGSGVAGIVASFLLQQQHRVTLFESEDRLGGHTNTIECDDGAGGIVAIDTGFIVCNDRTYPNFHRFLAKLGVPWRFSDMSVSVSSEVSGIQYCSKNLNTVFAQRKNLYSPRFLRMVAEVVRFWRAALKSLSQGLADDETLGAWLERHHFSGAVVDEYLVPIAASIWSSSVAGILDFPAGTFLEFYRNHGFLRFYFQPRWQTVVGGSYQYLKAFSRQFSGDIKLKSPVRSITADGPATIVRTDSEQLSFNAVVVATHADQAIRLLSDPSEQERAILSVWRYQKNHAVLHTDDSLMPNLKTAWGSWNYRISQGTNRTSPVSVTYDMNNLQGLSCPRRFFVTLNPTKALRNVIAEFDYEHPVYAVDAVRQRAVLPSIQGTKGRWFAGSYHGYGFHEDAVKSAVTVAEQFGCRL